MKKKLVSVLMCMAMGATLLAGCGSEEAADSSNTTAADAADADTAADSEAADASDAADAAYRIHEFRTVHLLGRERI